MKCPFVWLNDPMPSRQGAIVTILLSPFEDGYYSNRGAEIEVIEALEVTDHVYLFLASSGVCVIV